jgi:hypothetical protein
MIKKETRDAITAQVMQEISFARDAKRVKLTNWHKNEDLYYSNKKQISDERSNVNLNEAQGFVQSFLSRINSPFNFSIIRNNIETIQSKIEFDIELEEKFPFLIVQVNL